MAPQAISYTSSNRGFSVLKQEMTLLAWASWVSDFSPSVTACIATEKTLEFRDTVVILKLSFLMSSWLRCIIIRMY